MKLLRTLRDRGLSIALLGIFLSLLFAHSVAGWWSHQREQALHGRPPGTYLDFLKSGDFHESLAENWESEFLQMAAFVLLAVYLYQRGSSESKDPDKPEPVDEEPATTSSSSAPWPVRQGGLVLWIYAHSLSLAFLLLFGASFGLHALGGCEAYNDELRMHGRSDIGVSEYMGTSRFWFESLENWQSEFLAIFCMVVFTIYLRERGSPQSKPVNAPHDQTGAG